jgi:hypothetical protein
MTAAAPHVAAAAEFDRFLLGQRSIVLRDDGEARAPSRSTRAIHPELEQLGLQSSHAAERDCRAPPRVWRIRRLFFSMNPAARSCNHQRRCVHVRTNLTIKVGVLRRI